MIDLRKIKYKVVVSTKMGARHDIKNYIENLGWEENENEISMRLTFTAKNDKTSEGRLSSIIKPGCLVEVFATDNRVKNEEVARGYVESWNPFEQGSRKSLKAICYDELYKLQKSQDNRFYSSGTGTKTVVVGILKDWKIKQGDYKGPNVSHGKLVYNNRYLSDIILEVLEDARKGTKNKYLLRNVKGRVSVIKRGSNQTIYVFGKDNTQQISHTISTENLITRVKVIGKANDNGKTSIEAIVNGLTKYGVRQRIYTKGSEESLKDAKLAAQKILNSEGKIEKSVMVQSPDVPFIRKGDLVYVVSSLGDDYYYVKSIQHNCDAASMTMKLEKAEKNVIKKENKEEAKKEYKVGDIVNFKGGLHYVSSYKGAKGYKAKAGKAKITMVNGSGKEHPWHLIHIDSSSNVYGWVDNKSFD